ncbi:hypothetical protein AGMMS50229_16530 [Campylobacterota bacterium]|nr:hypothetical protein AGMMS50229_16530 [Campylobacterota bacterium]
MMVYKLSAGFAAAMICVLIGSINIYADQPKIVEIKERMFATQINDILLNSEEYMGKTIKLQGLFKPIGYSGENHYFVLRYAPGCCGDDGYAGFEVIWDSVSAENVMYPKEDEWVEAIGILKAYKKSGYPNLYLGLSSLKVMTKRGAEFVKQ